jgi:hypothetical protein
MDAFELASKLKAFDIEQAAELAFASDAFLRSVESEQVKQMKAGKNSEGKGIGRYRSPRYAAMKHAMNPLPGEGNVDLVLTGKFTSEIFAQSDSGVMEIASNDSKSADLESKYGETIFGLSSKFKETPEEVLQAELTKTVKNELGL